MTSLFLISDSRIMTLVQQFNISHLAALSGSDVHLLTETERVSNTTSV